MQTSHTDVDEAAGGRALVAAETGSWIPVTMLLGILGIILLQVLVFNDGHLVYDMDDPYIGYAVAEEIAKGNYGINPGELSAPASTILWPFLLAPFLLLPGGIWAPLLINVVCNALAVWVLYGSLAQTLRAGGAAAWRPLATAGALASILMLDMVFITFAGMEHGPQVLLAVIVASSLVHLVRASAARPSRALVAALVLGPLIRFEAMAITLPALAFLWARGDRKHAVWIAVVTAVPFLAFLAFLSANGIGPLPSSLAIRQPHMEGGGLVGVVVNIVGNTVQRQGLIVSMIMIPFLGIPLDRTRPVAERALGGWLLVVVVLHFSFGRFGYWGRYEAYLWATVLVTGAFLARHALARWAGAIGTIPAITVLALVALMIGYPYLAVTLKTPLASNDIYVEHREMNRLVTDFIQAPVGVNDVGYVAFENDHYVLDLFGLTSHDVRRARLAGGMDTRWMDELVREHGVDFVMIYVSPAFFPRFPESWTVVGHLRTERFKALLAQHTVTLLATRPEPVPELQAKLAAFSEGLPQGIRLDLRPIAPDSTSSPEGTAGGSEAADQDVGRRHPERPNRTVGR